uniref:Peptidase S1 domain-containing protein n=1 Tax=Timema poppense TaxID=170557 RepID=A0A7R9HBV7_TIMPO|nr:unnamed protein product [Timema poppensis]
MGRHRRIWIIFPPFNPRRLETLFKPGDSEDESTIKLDAFRRSCVLEYCIRRLPSGASISELGPLSSFHYWRPKGAFLRCAPDELELLVPFHSASRQPKAEWIARLGSVRLSGNAPWQQERAVVGMVKSPVEGSTVVMVKLERPVKLSDFVHPVCLPQEGAPLNLSYCNTLGWTRNRELLKRIELKASSMQSCENISIPTVNSFCSEPAYPTIGCNVSIIYLTHSLVRV